MQSQESTQWPRINVNFAPAIEPQPAAGMRRKNQQFQVGKTWMGKPTLGRCWGVSGHWQLHLSCNSANGTHSLCGHSLRHGWDLASYDLTIPIPSQLPYPGCTSFSIARESCTWCALNVDTDALALYSHLSQDMTATPLLSHIRNVLTPCRKFRFSLWLHVATTTIKPWVSPGEMEGNRVVDSTTWNNNRSMKVVL